MLPFHFEYVFEAPGPETIFEAFFDPACADAQDREVDIVAREVRESRDEGHVYHRVCKVVPKRQVPAIIRPLVPGELHYIEELRWDKPAHHMRLVVKPSLLKGRAQIETDYRLRDDGPAAGGWRRILRSYAGTISIDVPLLGGRIEKGIIADMEQSLKTTALSTQAWVNANRARGV